jgi:polyvinyl alcohol dehydrogenase (cytochrome)
MRSTRKPAVRSGSRRIPAAKRSLAAARRSRIVWDVDTAVDYPAAVNGVPARGGSIDGPGPVVVGGMLYAGSGYAVFGGMPGNVLLAFSVRAP